MLCPGAYLRNLGFFERQLLPPAQMERAVDEPLSEGLEHLTVSGTEGLRRCFGQHRPVRSTADVDYSTRKEPTPVLRSHLNLDAADSQWERIAATALDTHPKVESFVKNSGLGFAIPYALRRPAHDYLPDFVVKMDGGQRHPVVEIKGVTAELSDAKKRAAQMWCEAFSGEGSFGRWDFLQIESRQTIPGQLVAALEA